MSQIKPTLAILSMAAILGLAGCGDKNPQAVFEHPAGWGESHSAAAKITTTGCTECHGEQLNGGISNVNCATKCHIGDANHKHPVAWGTSAKVYHSTTASVSTDACKVCHGATLTGSGNAPSCATKCHIGDATHKHPVAWDSTPKSYAGHISYVETYTNEKCKVCHGKQLTGDATLNAPSCSSCHLGGANAVHPDTAGDWNNDHRGFILPGKTLQQTRASCDIAACHGSDRQVGGTIKVDKSSVACQVCHAGQKY